MIWRNDWRSVALWLTSSMMLGLPGAGAATARQQSSSTCEVPPPNCSTSAPRGFMWTGTSHCDVEQDGRVWNTCEYILPKTR
jgi:hypothetical protein